MKILYKVWFSDFQMSIGVADILNMSSSDWGISPNLEFLIQSWPWRSEYDISTALIDDIYEEDTSISEASFSSQSFKSYFICNVFLSTNL